MTDNLIVSFTREEEVEQRFVCTDPEMALRAAMVILITLDGLEAGDTLKVEAAPRPNLIERGLA
jgi:hypothetical protein